VLRYSENGRYDFASAYHIPTFLFLGLIVAMFLGLTNSADDIIRDRVILQRERNLNVRLPYYIFSKALVLGVFAAIQCLLYILIGNAILEIRGMFWIHFGFMFLTAFTGIALGLLISSLVADAKTAANIVPLVLIPQIILGGALIKYEEMNRNLDFVYTINRWLSTHSDEEKGRNESKLQVPFLCEFMPMRWSYEAVVVAQSKLNPLTTRQENVQQQIDRLVSTSPRTEVQASRLEDLKDTLAMLSGLESWSADEIDRRFRYVDRVLAGKPLETFELKSVKNVFAAEALYVNQKISDLVSKAETEQSDYRRTDSSGRRKPINVFFGPEKYLTLNIGGKTVHLECSVFTFNTLVLLGFSIGTLFLLHVSLRRQLSLPV
jgi:ABC transport system ATP-binding/permease protein